MPDERLTQAQKFFQDYFNGRVDDAMKLLAPTVVYYVAGTKEPAGTFVGPAAVAKHLEQFLALAQGPIDVLQWEDWLVGISHIAGVVRFELQRPGRIQEFRIVFLVGFNPGTKIDRIEVFFGDPEAFDRFFSW